MPDDKNRRGYGSRARLRHQLKEASVSSYAEYLRSDHWRELKASWVPRRTWQGKPVCELCLGRVGPFELHHKNYSRIGREPPKHLMLICRACHQWIHGWHERSGETLNKITKRVAILARKKGVRFRRERISAGAPLAVETYASFPVAAILARGAGSLPRSASTKPSPSGSWRARSTIHDGS